MSTVPPIRREILVNADLAAAFEVFTADLPDVRISPQLVRPMLPSLRRAWRGAGSARA